MLLESKESRSGKPVIVTNCRAQMGINKIVDLIVEEVLLL
jgi:hypothetical protein